MLLLYYINLTSIFKGAYSWRDHYDDMALRTKIRSRKWDSVVLQVNGITMF